MDGIEIRYQAPEQLKLFLVNLFSLDDAIYLNNLNIFVFYKIHNPCSELGVKAPNFTKNLFKKHLR